MLRFRDLSYWRWGRLALIGQPAEISKDLVNHLWCRQQRHHHIIDLQLNIYFLYKISVEEPLHHSQLAQQPELCRWQAPSCGLFHDLSLFLFPELQPQRLAQVPAPRLFLPPPLLPRWLSF